MVIRVFCSKNTICRSGLFGHLSWGGGGGKELIYISEPEASPY